jgi:hypothetical protein
MAFIFSIPARASDPERGFGERPQVDLADAAAGERLHTPGTLEVQELVATAA